MFDTLIDTTVLAAHLDDPEWVICDCRFALNAPDAGEAEYRSSHIPGAVYLHLDRELAGPITADSGRHPLPDPEALAALFSRIGVRAGTQLLAYDASQGAFAARLWWLARWLGHRDVAVLDGGWQAWIAAGGPVNAGAVSPRPGAFHVQRNDALWLDAAGVLDLVADRRPGRLLDARAAERFQGRNETLDPVAGHIPGAVNLPYTGNVDNNGRFKSPEALRVRFGAGLSGLPPQQAVCMCGSGVTACHNLLAMEHAGLHGARLYAGSWSEWIRDPARPVATGG
ncbi:MAG TPA: sulfurtransferase [Gammaproteobacteria bacterium]|nr:sulfurtransferase [Gammaproteobacteria bacterium]